MKICVIYGTERKGCTWHIAQEVLRRLTEAEVTEFFLPRDCPESCISCFRCFNEENRCYHSRGALEILELQPDGKKAMAASAFLMGHPIGTGTVLTG